MTCKVICKRDHPFCTFSGDGCVGQITNEDEAILDKIIKDKPSLRYAMIKFRHETRAQND